MSKPTIGIIGGGQLGSMLSTAAKNLNIKTIIISDDKNAPGQFFADEFIFCRYDDDSKIEEFCSKVDFVTFEFENIPYNVLSKIDNIKKVNPKPSINKIIQNRLSEKDFLNKNNVRTTSYISVKNEIELKSGQNLLPGILKTCTLGYDGKGQYKINNDDELENLKIDFTNQYILEKLVKLKKEISVIITRFGEQRYEVYDPIENFHEDQILKYSKIPAEVNKNLFDKSKEWARYITEELDYIVPHQANERIIEAIRKTINCPSGKMFNHISKYGNTSSNTIPIALNELMPNLPSGERVGLTAFGGGFTFGAAVIEKQ